MRKQFIIFLILVFLTGLIPLNFSTAITQNQIDAEVQIVCTDGLDNWFSGSGTIIDPKGIILTNRHVIEGAYMNTCFIGFIESISQEPNFGNEGNYNLAEVKYYTSTDDMDAAILYLDNPTNKSYPYVNIWDSNSDTLQFGDKIEAIGFPSIGGSTITYTSGDFSGFGGQSDGTQNYIKSTAQLEHGNSGGASYNPKGHFIGIPTMVVAGTLNSLSYILSVNSIKNWLSGILGSGYTQEVIKQKPTVVEPSSSIQSDITPPSPNNGRLCNSDGTGCTSNIDYTAYYDDSDNQVSYEDFDEHYEKPLYGEKIISDKYRKIRLLITQRHFYQEIDLESGLYSVYYKYAHGLKELQSAQEREYTIDPNNKPRKYMISLTPILSFPDQEGKNYISLRFKDKAGNISNSYIYVYHYLKEHYKNLQNIKFYADSSYKNIIGDYNFDLINSDSDFKFCVTKHKNIYVKWEYNKNYYSYIARSFPADMWNLTASDTVNNKDLQIITDKKYKISNLDKKEDDWWYDAYNICENKNDTSCPATKKVSSFLLKPVDDENNLFLEGKNIVVKFEYNPNASYDLLCGDPDMNRVNRASKPYYVLEEGNILGNNQILDDNLSNRLKGLILLRVESVGEAYYVYPNDSKRYYLGRPADAFNVMRELGLGATHEFITSNTIYPDNVLGKILLDVEQNGEAYYIYPKDKKAYYLGRPADAFRVMRELGLGITNNDLSKIPEGSL